MISYTDEKMRHREVKRLAQGHSACYWQNGHLNPDSIASLVVLLTRVLWARPLGTQGKPLFRNSAEKDTHPSAFLPGLHL